MTVPQITTDTNFEDVHIQLNPNGSLNMTYKGAVLFTNFFLPGYQGISGGRFGFGGRTGGANENQWIDNLQITTSLQPQVGISQQPFSQKVLQGHDALFTVQINSPDGAAPAFQWLKNGKFGFYARTGGLNENQWVDNLRILAIKSVLPLRITQEPADAAVLPGRTASFTVVVSDPNGATYRWSKNNNAIPGATSASYTTLATTSADNGATFSVQVVGPGGTVDSRQSVLSVVPPITINNPKISFDFNDGAVPPGTTLISAAGGGYVDSSGGVKNSGVLKLTDNNPAGGQTGS